jgi:hypothetical protein
MDKQFVAVVSLDGRVIHVVGPFPSEAQAVSEGRQVANGVDMFAPMGSQSHADVRVLPLFANLGALISAMA